jgi:hypothetical protein
MAPDHPSDIRRQMLELLDASRPADALELAEALPQDDPAALQVRAFTEIEGGEQLANPEVVRRGADRLRELEAHPVWIKLNKRTIGRNSGWAPGNPGCLLGDKEPSKQCDESPFWSTMQGKNGTLTSGFDPHLQWVTGKDNTNQGVAVGKFYNSGSAGVYPAGCEIQADDDTDWYLMVPLPEGMPLDTTWTCNRP